MKGLLYKDIVISLKNTIFATILSIFLIVSSLFLDFEGNNFAIIVYSAIMSISIMSIWTMISFASFDNDEKCSWNKFVNTLSIPKKDIILSKYISVCLYLLVGVAFSFIQLFVVNIHEDFKLTISSYMGIYIAFLLVLILLLMLIPLYIKFSSKSAGVILIITLILLMMLLTIIVYFGDTMNFLDLDKLLLSISNVFIDNTKEAIKSLVIKSSIFSLVFLVLSYFISLNIYKNKNF